MDTRNHMTNKILRTQYLWLYTLGLFKESVRLSKNQKGLGIWHPKTCRTWQRNARA